jgi:hypothetical protein
MATGKVFPQNPSLPASYEVVMVKNQIGFKSSAGIHSALLSSFPIFQLAAGLRRSAGRKSTHHSEERMLAGRLEKASVRG